MQFPSAESDLLMAAPSLSRAPVAPVPSTRSLPARSTSETRERVSTSSVSQGLRSTRVTVNSTTVCARDDVSFIPVAATVRLTSPVAINAAIAS